MKNQKPTIEFSITILRKRLFAILLAITFLFLCIFGRLLYVQVVWGNDLQEKAIDQWTREIPIIASRGLITDRNGVILANNDDTYTIFVRKKAVKDIDALTKNLSTVLNLDYSYVHQRLTTTKSSEVTIKKQVKKSQLEELLNLDTTGVYYARDNSRVYPYNEMLSAVMGFTSNDGKGQAGLELYYDKYLSGINGEILYETDIVGVEIENGKASYLPATSGLNVKLTIDYEIQQMCDSAMAQAMKVHNCKSAQMIVIDPSNGEILALSSKPSYNLNEVPRDDIPLLNTLNRCGLISDIYEPGSTFKILTSAANIEEYLQGNSKAFSPEHVFNSSRYRYIDGTKVKCWSNHSNGKHANLNLQGALNNSCNPIFVDIGMSLGKTTMYKYLEKFNYGSVTGVDFSGESQGMVLPEQSVQNVDLCRIAFGQTIACTGLQLISATAAAINGGIYYTPHFMKEIYSKDNVIAQSYLPNAKGRVISQEASSILNSMLEEVVTSGSGKNAYIEGYRVAGKTGVFGLTCVIIAMKKRYIMA